MAKRLRQARSSAVSLYVKAFAVLVFLGVVVTGMFMLAPERAAEQPAGRFILNSPTGDIDVTDAQLNSIAPEIAGAELSRSRVAELSPGSFFVTIPNTYPNQAVGFKINEGTWQSADVAVLGGELGIIIDAVGARSISVAYSHGDSDVKIVKYNVG